MLLVKNRLIFGAIKTVFGAIFKTIYGILGLFSLQPLVFCAVAGALLEIAFRAVSGSDAGFILFHLILCLCVLYAVLRTVYRLLGLGRKKSNGAKGRRSSAISKSGRKGITFPRPRVRPNRRGKSGRGITA